MLQAMSSPAALLRYNANYRNTWLAQVVSEIGDYFNNVAVFALVMERSGSGMIVSLGDRRTPPWRMIATIDRMRCWLVPMRPVTPFMMMPTLCVFIVLS